METNYTIGKKETFPQAGNPDASAGVGNIPVVVRVDGRRLVFGLAWSEVNADPGTPEYESEVLTGFIIKNDFVQIDEIEENLKKFFPDIHKEVYGELIKAAQELSLY